MPVGRVMRVNAAPIARPRCRSGIDTTPRARVALGRWWQSWQRAGEPTIWQATVARATNIRQHTAVTGPRRWSAAGARWPTVMDGELSARGRAARARRGDPLADAVRGATREAVKRSGQGLCSADRPRLSSFRRVKPKPSSLCFCNRTTHDTRKHTCSYQTFFVLQLTLYAVSRCTRDLYTRKRRSRYVILFSSSSAHAKNTQLRA